MYGDQQLAKQDYPVAQQEPELSILNNLLNKANAEYADILYSVEDKLHSILNLRTPDKEPIANPASKSLNDFVGTINDQLQTYRNQNGRLQKVLDHIKRLAG